jgi:hypothetical protein
MRRTLVTTLAVLLLASAAPAAAQQEAPGVVAKWHLVIAKPGEALQFENSYREHLKLHAANNDPWAWNTWQIVNGQNLGQYVILSPNHTWQEFDRHEQASRMDMADLTANVLPYVQTISSTLEAVEPAISNWTEESAQPKLVEIMVFKLKYDRTRQFYEAAKKLHQAVIDHDPTRQYAWFTTVNGSDGPKMMLAIPHENWAAMKREGPSVWQLLEQAYGTDGAEKVRSAIESSIRSQHSYILEHRADLSYVPVAQ